MAKLTLQLQIHDNCTHLWKGIFDTFDKYKMDLGQDPENAVSYVDKLKQKQGPLNKEVLLSKAIVSSELMKHLKENIPV